SRREVRDLRLRQVDGVVELVFARADAALYLTELSDRVVDGGERRECVAGGRCRGRRRRHIDLLADRIACRPRTGSDAGTVVVVLDHGHGETAAAFDGDAGSAAATVRDRGDADGRGLRVDGVDHVRSARQG